MTVNILPGDPEAFNLYGEPLYRSPMREDIYEAQKVRYDEAYENYPRTLMTRTTSSGWAGGPLILAGTGRLAPSTVLVPKSTPMTPGFPVTGAIGS
jgi:hypothetical protein